MIGILWILLSDRAVEQITLDPARLTTISIYKGWGFILVTTLMLYWLIQRHTAELGEDESRLRLVTDAMPALISYVDSDLRYRFSNQAYEEWFGHKADGKKIDEVLGTDAYRKIARYVDEALRGRLVTYQTEIPYLGKGTRFVEATHVPDRGENGQVKGFFALVQDITERRQAEGDLRLWADAFEHCAHGIAISDAATNRIVACNSAFALLHKSRVEDVVGTAILSLYAPVDHDQVRRNATRADQVGHAQFEARMIRRDGSTFPVQLDLVSVVGENGELLYRVATVQDITNRKQAEEEIAHQASLLAQVNDAVITADENFFITSWNAAAERIYGWQLEEVVGKRGEEILHTEFFNISRPEALQGLREKGEFSAEVTQLRKDGTRFPVETRTAALRNEHGTIRGYVSVNRDIIERKRA
ncbi:MAG TPA: PAS domain S-box protein, partial [Anaerolineales bacterium]|nr:PAS domain S-box protein [Anaerolineales bacterium]